MYLAPLFPYAHWVLLFVRLAVGAVMLYFGLPKIKNLKSNSEDFVKMGFRPGMFWGTIVALVEVVGGALLVLGAYVWIVAAAFGFEMLMGTIWKITKAHKPFPDYSYDIVLLALCLVLLALGPGQYNLFTLLGL